jgi:hypothetical protein
LPEQRHAAAEDFGLYHFGLEEYPVGDFERGPIEGADDDGILITIRA